MHAVIVASMELALRSVRQSVSKFAWGWALLALVCAGLGGCSIGRRPPAPVSEPSAQPEPIKPVEPPAPEPRVPLASASNVQAYRVEMAKHIYQQHAHRVHAGRLPPMLKGVGVVEVTVNQKGQVIRMDWIRAPKHVPEVVKAIEDMIEAAQPYPAPRFAPQASFMETWLWNRNDRFQLDSLTLGQD